MSVTSSTTSSAVSVKRCDMDSYLTAVSERVRKNIRKERLKKARTSYAFVCDVYKTALSFKQFNTSFNYITCMVNLINCFPHLLDERNAEDFINVERRMKGVVRCKQSNTYKLNILDSISKKLFYDILPFTGANLLITNISEPNLDEIDMYDTINDITPVVFSCMLSPKTALITCLDPEKAQFLAKRCNNCLLTTEDTDVEKAIASKSRIKCIYIASELASRTKVFNWTKRCDEHYYYNKALRYQVPLSFLVEYSNMMKTRE